MIGPACFTPNGLAPWPSWKTTTTRPTTVTGYGISAACTFSAMSMFGAVVPVTSKVASAADSGRGAR